MTSTAPASIALARSYPAPVHCEVQRCLANHGLRVFPDCRASSAFGNSSRFWTCALSISVASVVVQESRTRSSRRSRSILRAILQKDAHSQAMRRWIDKLVIGHGFCPWAKPADEAARIRVVTSSAETEQGVLADLQSEAMRLPQNNEDELHVGVATTTVLVCPHIPTWSEFDAFSRFFVEELDSGQSLAESLGLRVVGFHPTYTRCKVTSYREGSRVAVTVGSSGATANGIVVCADAGQDETGHALMEVHIDRSSSEQWLVGTNRRVRIPGRSAEDLATSAWKDLALRSPRPALHLLRFCDLNKASAEMGNNMFTDRLFVRNERLAREYGREWAAQLLRSCEGDLVAEHLDETKDRCPSTSLSAPSNTTQLLASESILSTLRGYVVMWCDSDPAVASSGNILREAGLEIHVFTEPEALLEAYRLSVERVVGIMSSMMEGNGRRERGMMNAYGLISACLAASTTVGACPPVCAIVSLTADRDTAIAAGADFVVYGNRARAQQRLLRKIQERREAVAVMDSKTARCPCT